MDLLEVKQELLKLEPGEESAASHMAQNNTNAAAKMINIRSFERKIRAAIADSCRVEAGINMDWDGLYNADILTRVHSSLVYGVGVLIRLIRLCEAKLQAQGRNFFQFDPNNY